MYKAFGVEAPISCFLIALINSIASSSNFLGQNAARMPPAIPQIFDRL
ncbi:hypothetical protein QUA13_12675 [Microcoleus sp. S28C3]